MVKMGMNYLGAEQISKEFRDKILFNNISFGIQDSDKIGFIGNNGSGKSTLIKILAGELEPDNGKITRNRDLKISYLPQEPPFDPAMRVGDYLVQDDTEEMRLIREYENLTSSEMSAAEQTRLGEVMIRMDECQAWDKERAIHSILTEIGITDLKAPMGTLSGGMLKKVFLGQALIRDSGLLILDEPTNHLDGHTILFLQKFLIRTEKALLLVTHDRYFLDAVCNKIYELEQGDLFQHQGNYSFYLDSRAQRIAHEASHQKRLNNVLRNELEWLHRGPKARTSKDKKRKERISEMQGRISGPGAESRQFDLDARRLGKKILNIHQISKSFDDKTIINDFSFEFSKGDRIGIVGGNGSGKTTLLNLLTSRLIADSGTIEPGQNTVIGYFDQKSLELPEETKVIDYVKETAQVIEKDGRHLSPSQFLELFLVDSGMQYSPISKLSGGERRKIYLLKILLTNPNFLVLDEPTNDLDISTLSLLEEFLQSFGGCLVVVSHDRYFLDRTTDLLFILNGTGKTEGYGGDYSTWLESQQIKSGSKASKSGKQKSSKTEKTDNTDSGKTEKGSWRQKKSKKISFKEKNEYESLEKELPVLESRKTEMEQKFSDPNLSPDKLQVLTAEYESLLDQIRTKEDRWEELFLLTEESSQ